METINTPLDGATQEWFKNRSLELLGNQLQERNYPGYPAFEDRFFEDQGDNFEEPGTWWTEEPQAGLPRHPWFNEMVRSKSIGALAGRGFYYHYGANHTADPIVTRHDQDETHVLLITRKDTGALALPGGFQGNRETPFEAAMREFREEARRQLLPGSFAMRKVYDGPLADLRVTAHAWPHTHAYHLKLNEDSSRKLSMEPYEAGDDAAMASWVPASEVSDKLFGSHRLLIELALRQEVRT